MACNVFGTPVNLETLKGIPEYAHKSEKDITRKELGEVAIALKNAEGKDINARAYVENMYKRYEDIQCTLGLIYNATGSTLKLDNYYNWFSFVSPAPLPAFIENGQWGAFLCVSENLHEVGGCAGLLRYWGFDFNHEDRVHYFIGWDTHCLPTTPQVFVDITEMYSKMDDDVAGMKKNVNASGQHTLVEKNGLMLSATIGSDKMAVLEVILRPNVTSPTPTPSPSSIL